MEILAQKELVVSLVPQYMYLLLYSLYLTAAGKESEWGLLPVSFNPCRNTLKTPQFRIWRPN
jgi:hypothetical protein